MEVSDRARKVVRSTRLSPRWPHQEPRRRNRGPGWSPPITVTMHNRRSETCPRGACNPSGLQDQTTRLARCVTRRVIEKMTNSARKPHRLLDKNQAACKGATWTPTANVRSVTALWSRRGVPVAGRGAGVRLVVSGRVSRRCVGFTPCSSDWSWTKPGTSAIATTPRRSSGLTS
jgi:hypothetical protein